MLGEKNSVPENKLYIFKDMTLPCTGPLKKWEIYAKSGISHIND